MTTPVTEFGFSYEYGLDIWDPTAEEWLTFRFPTGLAPTAEPVTADAATYDDLGSPNEAKLSESWSMGGTVQQHRLATGDYLPEVELLKSYTEPDATGNKAIAKVRYYDKPAEGVPNMLDAYEGDCTVSFSRGETGNTGIGAWNFTLTGKGRRRQITNPWTGWGDDDSTPTEP